MGLKYWINPEPLIELYLKLGARYDIPLPLLQEMESEAYSLVEEILTAGNPNVERRKNRFVIALEVESEGSRSYADDLAGKAAKKLETMLTEDMAELLGVSRKSIENKVKLVPELLFCKRDFALGRVIDYSELRKNEDQRVVNFCVRIYGTYECMRKYSIEEFEQFLFKGMRQFNLFHALTCVEERKRRGLSVRGMYNLTKAHKLFDIIEKGVVTSSFVSKCIDKNVFLQPDEYASLYAQVDRGFLTVLLKTMLGQNPFTLDRAIAMIKNGVAVDILRAVYEQPPELKLGYKIRLARADVFPDFTNLFLALGLNMADIIRLSEMHKRGIELSFLEDLVGAGIMPKDARFERCVQIHTRYPLITISEVLAELELEGREQKVTPSVGIGVNRVATVSGNAGSQIRKRKSVSEQPKDAQPEEKPRRQYEVDYNCRISASALPRLSFGEWRAVMERMGGREVPNNGGSHAIFRFGRRRVPLPRHGDVSPYTAASALNRAGVNREQLMKVLR